MARIYTVGYGSEFWPEVRERVRAYGVTHLLDIRTNPYSRYQEDFRGKHFAKLAEADGIRYVFMGDSLGAKPKEEFLYTNDRLDYTKMRALERFQKGIAQVLEAARAPERTLCLLCGCAYAAKCHRGKLLSYVLKEQGAQMAHIEPGGRLMSQEELEYELAGAQPTLFDLPPDRL